MEYLNHVLAFQPGPEGATQAQLNEWADKGWRVVTTFLIPLSPSLLTGQQGVGLWVLLERTKGEADEPGHVRQTGKVGEDS